MTHMMSLLDGEHLERRRNLTGVRRRPAVTEDAAASPELSWGGGQRCGKWKFAAAAVLCRRKKNFKHPGKSVPE